MATIRTRKVMTNRLLNRKQMLVDVFHPNLANVSKATLKEQLAKNFKVEDENRIVLYGFRTQFGGGKSCGFAFIYDSLQDALSYEPKYRLIRAGHLQKVETSRRSRKELKNRKKKVRGKEKAKVGATAKK